MLKKSVSFGIGLLLLTFPVLVSAQTATTNNNSGLIAILEQLVAVLTQELNALIAAQTQTVTTGEAGVGSSGASGANGSGGGATDAGGGNTGDAGTGGIGPFCNFNGQTMSSGQSVTAYQSSAVAYGQSCVSQVRSCSNGTLSGSYPYASCAVQPAGSCTLGGETIASGQSGTFYSSSSGSSCASINRLCTNGTLSGSAAYDFASCTVTGEAGVGSSGASGANGSGGGATDAGGGGGGD
jgi:hypothetical protein